MLVLSRKRYQKIAIGKGAEILVEVMDIRGDKVRIGITAAPDIPVHRHEVFEAIQRHQQGGSS